MAFFFAHLLKLVVRSCVFHEVVAGVLRLFLLLLLHDWPLN